MSRFAPLESVTLPQPIALRFRDVASRAMVRTGLNVTVTEQVTISGSVLLKRPCPLTATASGYWTAPRLGGFDGSARDRTRVYRVDVSDPGGGYLPTRFTLTLPPVQAPLSPGEISPWTGMPASLSAFLKPAGAAADDVPDFVPLFPGVARSAPSRLAEVRAHLLTQTADGGEADLTDALLSVSMGGRLIGLGRSDARGAVIAAFPYPDLPARVSAEQPVWPAIWTDALSINVFWRPNANDVRDLADILEQSDGDAVTPLKVLPDEVPLGLQSLTLGTALILRTDSLPDRTISSLYVKTV